MNLNIENLKIIVKAKRKTKIYQMHEICFQISFWLNLWIAFTGIAENIPPPFGGGAVQEKKQTNNMNQPITI